MLKELTVTIKGRPCSKKNSREFRRSARGGYTIPGEAYEKFRTHAISQLQIVRRDEKFGGVPVYMEYKFFKLGMSVQDVDNAIASINDILQDKVLKIIDDDKQIMSGKFDVYPGNDSWYTVIYIRQLYCNPGEHIMEKHDEELTLCKVCNLTDDLIKGLHA